MSLLQRLTPLNLLEEKERFLSEQNFNPVFHYENPVEEKDLTKYGFPKPEYVALAQEILDKAYFGRNERDLVMSQGKIIPHQEVTRRTQAFLDMHNLGDNYKIVWSASFVSRATINADTIKLRSTSEFRQQNLLGMLYHEIGTHAIRRHNYQQQPWFKKKKKHGFGSYLKTEEGLASLHSLLPMEYKSAFSTAIRYLAVHYAQHHSLLELWQFLGKYIQDPETRWMVTFRQKRGISNSEHGGGFTKDLVYFEGMLEMYHWLKNNAFDLTPLYFGKLSYQDIDTAQTLNPNFQPLLPSFFTLDREKYEKNILAIGQENKFDYVSTENH